MIDPATKPRRRWLAISLRVFMVLILGVACALGWLMHRVRVQRRAVEAITAAGGTIVYDWQLVNGRVSMTAPPPKSTWLRKLLGPEMFETVRRVVFTQGDLLDDSVVAQVAELRGVRYLQIMEPSRVTGAALASHEGMNQLEMLDLSEISPTDDELAHLAKLTSLKRLYIDGRNVTDGGMFHLRKLTNLLSLSIGMEADDPPKPTKITSAGLVHLKDMSRITTLTIPNSQITSIIPVLHLSTLKEINLDTPR